MRALLLVKTPHVPQASAGEITQRAQEGFIWLQMNVCIKKTDLTIYNGVTYTLRGPSLLAPRPVQA